MPKLTTVFVFVTYLYWYTLMGSLIAIWCNIGAVNNNNSFFDRVITNSSVQYNRTKWPLYEDLTVNQLRLPLKIHFAVRPSCKWLLTHHYRISNSTNTLFNYNRLLFKCFTVAVTFYFIHLSQNCAILAARNINLPTYYLVSLLSLSLQRRLDYSNQEQLFFPPCRELAYYLRARASFSF